MSGSSSSSGSRSSSSSLTIDSISPHQPQRHHHPHATSGSVSVASNGTGISPPTTPSPSPIGALEPSLGGLLSFVTCNNLNVMSTSTQQFVSVVTPLLRINITDMGIMPDGPSERVLTPSILAVPDDPSSTSLSATIYATYKSKIVVLLKLCPVGVTPCGGSDAALTQLTNEVNIMSEVPESMSHTIVHILGQTIFKSSIYIVFDWIQDGVIHSFLKQFEPSQMHRITRWKKTMQAMTKLKTLYRAGVRQELVHPHSTSSNSSSSSSSSSAASPSSDLPSLSSATADPAHHHYDSTHPHQHYDISTFLSIPPEEVTFLLDHHGERRKLGRGTFATVYLGKYHNKYVAIKQAHPDLSDSALANIEKEVRLLYEARSEHIVRIEGICQKDGSDLIVMEYLPSDLFHYLQEHDPAQITWTQRLKWIKQLSEGLRVLHERDIAHRDQKSANFLLDADLNLKITDFGLANYGTDTHAPRAVGSPVYMPQESFPSKTSGSRRHGLFQCGLLKRLMTPPRSKQSSPPPSHSPQHHQSRPASPATAASPTSSPFFSMDTWSFGMNLIEIITGQRPFFKIQHNVQAEVIRLLRDLTFEQLKSHLPSFPESCPVKLYQLILECIQLDPQSRPNMSDITAKLNSIDLHQTLSISQWRQHLSTMTACLQTIDSFAHARTMIGYYSLYMTDDESRDFEYDYSLPGGEVERIREYIQKQYAAPVMTQATHADSIEIGEEINGHGKNSRCESPSILPTRRPSIDQQHPHSHHHHHPHHHHDHSHGYSSSSASPGVKYETISLLPLDEDRTTFSHRPPAHHIMNHHHLHPSVGSSIPSAASSLSPGQTHAKKLSGRYTSSQLPPEALKQYEQLLSSRGSSPNSATENKVGVKLTQSKSAQNISSMRA